MATYPRSDLFVHLRNSYRSTSFLSPAKADHEHLLRGKPQGPGSGIELGIIDRDWYAWLKRKQDLTARISRVNDDIDRLQERQRSSFRSLFQDSDSDSNQLNIQATLTANALVSIQREIDLLFAPESEGRLRPVEKVKTGVQIALANRLGLAVQRFQLGQRQYISSRTIFASANRVGHLSQQRPRPRPASDGPEQELSEASWSPGQGRNETMRYELLEARFVHDEELSRQSLESVRNLHEAMSNVAQLSRDMHLIVKEQGTLLDRVDYNVENAGVQLQAAVAVIQRRADMESLSRRQLTVLLMLMMVLILLMAVLFKPK